MRIVYVDESGITKEHPNLVVAGVIVDADTQLVPLEEELARLVGVHVPAEHRPGFIFHASEIYGGSGIFKDRDAWPHNRRNRILDDLAAIPGKLRLPLCVQAVARESSILAEPEGAALSPHLQNVALHAIALLGCCMAAERWMREHASANEVAMIKVENNADVRETVNAAYKYLRSGEDPELAFRFTRSNAPNAKIFARVRDGLSYADKGEAPALQIADFVSWATRRSLLNDRHAERFFNPFARWIFRHRQANDKSSWQPPALT